jgi:deoxyribodipyrimidine photo-lyase
MSEKTILVWFRNDLRTHDNEILLEAIHKADKVLPVYCVDPYYFKQNLSGNPKTGNIRARFILESVANLRKNLRGIGGELVVRFGNPAEILPQLAEEYQVNEVYHHREVAHEETEISEQVETALWKIKLNLKHFIGHTLYHKEDLPFPIKDIPDSFAVFKKKVERDSNVRDCIATPESITTPEIIDSGEIPTLRMLGLDEPIADPRAINKFSGGEDEALTQLNDFFANNSHLVIGKKGSLINLSKLSPWISLGCISLRQVYWEITKHQQLNNTHYPGMLLDLLWRDYFRFMFKKHGPKFIALKDPSYDVPGDVISSNKLFERWEHGETGVPLVDAIMHELNATGYISNYNRQIVAVFLVKELNVDWKKGAAYFEEKLIDYSPASNWGNWAFIAGVNDARESRYTVASLPITEQTVKNSYIETWLQAFKGDDYKAYAVK